MTEDKRRELFESEMKKSNKYAPSLMKWKNDRYEFDTMHAAYCGFCVALEAKWAALKMPDPVAHLWQHSETGRTRIVKPDMVVTADANWIVVSPLYTEQQVRELLASSSEHPRPMCAAATNGAERKPLTDDQIESLLVNWPKDGIAFFDFARSIERAHGIGVPQ